MGNVITRGGVAYDFNLSPYTMTVNYSDEVLTFVFSSALNRDKFSRQIQGNRDKINGSLTNRFSLKIVNNKLCDLKLYTTIEKRGFLIYKGQVKILCVNEIILDGARMMING